MSSGTEPSVSSVSAFIPRFEYLRVTGLHAFYGESHILHGIDFTVNRGELVTLLGRNGAGRTTTLKAILGLAGRRTGSIMINGREGIGLPTHKIAHLGIGYCPEERGIYSQPLLARRTCFCRRVVSSGGMGARGNLRDVPPAGGRERTPGAGSRAESSRCSRWPHPAHRGQPAAAGRDHAKAWPP